MSDEKLALPYGEFKAEDAHLEHAEPLGTRIVRPARVFSAEEEAKLYRKLDIKVSSRSVAQQPFCMMWRTGLTTIGPLLQLLPMLAVLYLLSFMISRFLSHVALGS